MTMISSATDFGTLDQIVASTSHVKQTINQLSQQTSSGYVSTDYAGLGAAAAPALDLTTQIAAQATLTTNTQSASTTAAAAQDALGQIASIAGNFATQAINLANLPSTVGDVAVSAQDALQQVAGLLNTKVGDVYVFAGQDSSTPPVPNPNTITQSAFYAAIQTAMAGLTTNGAAATQTATLVVASPGLAGTSPFSPSLDANSAQSNVDLGGGVRVALAPLANANAGAVSTGTGTSSTGSYTRDIMMSLAELGSLTTAQSTDKSFLPFVQGAITTLQGSVSAVNVDIGALGARQDQITSAQTEIGQSTTALQTQLSNLQDADLTTVAAKLSQAQTQLQASYQILATLNQLTLAKFLPA